MILVAEVRVCKKWILLGIQNEMWVFFKKFHLVELEDKDREEFRNIWLWIALGSEW